MIDKKNVHLERISIKGFKSIKSLEIDMKPINILIGANGSGKSNFISLFTFLRNLSEGKLQTYIERNGYANTFFHFGAKKTSHIQIDIDVGLNGYHVKLAHGVANDTLVFDEEYCTFVASRRRFNVQGQKGESGLRPDSLAESNNVKAYTLDYLQDCRVYHFHDTSSTAGFKQACDLGAADYLYPSASNIAAFLYRLKTSEIKVFRKSYLDIVDAVRTVSPYFHDFYLEPRGDNGNHRILLKWLHRDHEDPFSANQLSDGTARFICMATLFLQPNVLKPKSIVLDEPELGLHPAALESLADIVKSVSKNHQVICSTQSVTFANQFNPEDFIVVDQIKGESSFKRVTRSELECWFEDYSMGDIWNKNLIGGMPEW